MAKEVSRSAIPTWTNLPCDGGFWVHARTVEDFIHVVVEPTFETIEGQINALNLAKEGPWQFEQSDLEDLREETGRAFALSLQSFWERQFRGFIAAANAHLALCAPEAVGHAMWPALRKMFREQRGWEVDRLGYWTELEQLNLIGNACRHGEGKSADDLRARWPDLWPYPHYGGVSGLMIDLPLLRKLAAAIVGFWEAAEDVYENSIVAKHPSLVEKLAQAEARWPKPTAQTATARGAAARAP